MIAGALFLDWTLPYLKILLQSSLSTILKHSMWYANLLSRIFFFECAHFPTNLRYICLHPWVYTHVYFLNFLFNLSHTSRLLNIGVKRNKNISIDKNCVAFLNHCFIYKEMFWLIMTALEMLLLSRMPHKIYWM